VTLNLRDGPSPDASGTRHWQGTTYVHPDDFQLLLDVWVSKAVYAALGLEHPDDFQLLLDVWSDVMETCTERPILSIAEYWESRQRRAGTAQTPIPPQIEQFLAELERRNQGNSQPGGIFSMIRGEGAGARPAEGVR
jgi:hypothetical protein